MRLDKLTIKAQELILQAQALDTLPQVSGAGDVYLSMTSQHVLDSAFTEADKMKGRNRQYAG